jgi:hypothetical protein
MADQCKATPLGGGQCELDKGHDGKHLLHFPAGGVFSWTHESQVALINAYERGY